MSKFIAIIILALLCSLGNSYADYPGTVWRTQLAVPSADPENVKSNILSPDESKIYVLTQRVLLVYNTEDGGFLKMYTNELQYSGENIYTTFAAGALSKDGDKFFIVGRTYFMKDNKEDTNFRFFVFDLSSEEIVYDELITSDNKRFLNMVYSPGRQRVYILTTYKLLKINTNDFSDRSSSSVLDLFLGNLFISPDDNHLALIAYRSVHIPPSQDFLAEYFVDYNLQGNPSNYSFIGKENIPPDINKPGCFTYDSKYFCYFNGSIMRAFNLTDDNVEEYHSQNDLIKTPYFSNFIFSKKHHYKGIASMHGDVKRTVMISFSETEDISGVIIKNTGSDFVRMTEAEDFYYEISVDTLSKHILDWGYTKVSDLPQAIRTSEVYPNPVDDLLIVDFELSQTNATMVELVNAAGISVRRIDAGLLNEGEHSIGVNVANLPAGVYVTRVRSGRSLFTNKFVKVE